MYSLPSSRGVGKDATAIAWRTEAVAPGLLRRAAPRNDANIGVDRRSSAVKDFSRVIMNENFRQFIDRLREAKELVDLRQPVDIRHIATLVDQSDKALLFHDVIGYDMPVVSGIIRTRERSIMGMGCTE